MEQTRQDKMKYNEGDQLQQAKKFKSDMNNDEKQIQETGPAPQVKRKVALLLGFCGAGYLGMQRNPGTKTIEEDLINALFQAGVISIDSKEHEQKVAFQRASRTDKGVSAAAQVVSLKMFMQENAVAKINSQLPDVIRVYGCFRVTKGFNAKTSCDARSYEYLMPTYAFAHKDKQPGRDFFLPQYRADDATLKLVQQALSLYVGTRNYYNFTSKKAYEDDSAKRYIMEFKCGTPFVHKNIEFVVLTVKGQSFMQHQIRKMIGLLIGVVRGDAPMEAIEKAWGKTRVDIPRAPGLGLLLDKLYYHAYNRKIERLELHTALDADVFKKEIEEFKKRYIYDFIVEKEVKEYCFLKWIDSLTRHTFDERQTVACGSVNDSDNEIDKVAQPD